MLFSANRIAIHGVLVSLSALSVAKSLGKRLIQLSTAPFALHSLTTALLSVFFSALDEREFLDMTALMLAGTPEEQLRGSSDGLLAKLCPSSSVPRMLFSVLPSL